MANNYNQAMTAAQGQGLNAQPKKMTFSMAINTSGYQKLINQTLKDPAKVSRFVSAITSAVAVNPALQECDPATILSGALLGESLGLSPALQLGQYYLVPFNNNKKGCKEAQFQLGYKGYVQLALRSGYYKRLNVMSVKAGELKRYDPMWEEIEIELIEDEATREKTQTIGYVAMFEYQNGFRKVLYWSRDKMEAHALRYSKGYKAKSGYTFWEKDFDAMAYKTMLRQLISKWGIMSIDLQTAFEQDNTFESEADYLTADEVPQLAPVTDTGMQDYDADAVIVDDSTGEVVEDAPKPKRGRKKAAPVNEGTAASQPGLDDL